VGLPTALPSYTFSISFAGLLTVPVVTTFNVAAQTVTCSFSLTVNQTTSLSRGVSNYRLFAALDSEHVTDIVPRGPLTVL
jgi:hypothetical protein